MTHTAPTRPLPHPTHDTAPFWEGCAAGELRVQRCDACGHHRFPPAPLCPRCWSRDATWVRCGGGATLRSAVTFHQLYHPAFADVLPYTVGIVELDEGPCMYATVRGIDRGGDAELVEGVHLVLGFDRVAEGIALPVFSAVATSS
jgi:uncharacterized OB-fold protein